MSSSIRSRCPSPRTSTISTPTEREAEAEAAQGDELGTFHVERQEVDAAHAEQRQVLSDGAALHAELVRVAPAERRRELLHVQAGDKRTAA